MFFRQLYRYYVYTRNERIWYSKSLESDESPKHSRKVETIIRALGRYQSWPLTFAEEAREECGALAIKLMMKWLPQN